MRTALLIFTALSLVLAACGAGSDVKVPISEVASSGVTGSAVLTAAGTRTIAKIELSGLKASETYRVQLQAGTLEQPSASFSLIAELTADKDGRASAEAPVRFRDADLDLATVADGSRILVVQGATGTVAGGAIAAQR